MSRYPYRQIPAADGPASFIGSNVQRQGKGDPGHCEACVSVGHVKAHPSLGCGDVGCVKSHDPAVNPFTVHVSGRPAPQGSKEYGSAGQMRESSKYLPAWRQKIIEAVYRRYKELGIKPVDLPLFRGAVGFSGCFYLDTGQRIDSEPDLDKLVRAVWDPLKIARLIEDDGRFVVITNVRKVQAPPGAVYTGADITVWQETLEGSDE